MPPHVFKEQLKRVRCFGRDVAVARAASRPPKKIPQEGKLPWVAHSSIARLGKSSTYVIIISLAIRQWAA